MSHNDRSNILCDAHNRPALARADSLWVVNIPEWGLNGRRWRWRARGGGRAAGAAPGVRRAGARRAR
ncbi:hypothetical protein AB1K56_09455, partial [Microbacterium sp. BWR-S6Y]|uniref:hypothetical protein n=1 Tax=Microbacterium sp. BWR-S6Y TaxID=3232073 RepID=UPI003528679C